MRKKLIKFGVVLILLFLVVYVGFIVVGYRNKQLVPRQYLDLDQVVIPISIAPPPPPVTLVPRAPKSVSFSYAGVPPVLPTSLPMYQVVESEPAEKIVSSYALSLGLTNPEVSVNKNVSTLRWKDDKHVVALAKNGAYQIFSYVATSTTPVSDARPVDLDLISREFIKKNILPNANTAISLVSRSDDSSREVVSGGTPTHTTQLLYSFLVDEKYPLLVVNFNPVSVRFALDQSGSVNAASLSYPPRLTGSKTNSSLLAYDGILRSLNSNMGLLVWAVDPVTRNGWGVDPDFQTVQVNNILVVYYYDAQGGRLRPAYLLDGVGFSQNKNVKVRYFLLASN